MDFIVFEVHIHHTEEKELGSVASNTQVDNRPNEAEQTCDHVVDDQRRRNISNMDTNEQTSHPNISSPTATESDDMNREVDSERPNICIDSNITTSKINATNEDVQTPSIKEAAKVTETPVQVLNNGRLEETEIPVQVLNGNDQLEENTNVTETPVQVLNGNDQLEENTNVTETPVQVLSGNGQLVENTSVTETPVQVLNDNGRLKRNTSVTEKGLEKSSATRLFPSPSGSGNSKNTENGLKKVVKKRSPESSSKPKETKGRESDEDKKHLAASVLAVWPQKLSPEQEDIFQKPDTRSRFQKLLARRRGEKDKKPVKRTTTTTEPTMMSQLDARLKALDQAINRDFHDDLVMARQLTMPKLFQRSPKLQARWQVMHDERMLQEILVGMHWARERREEEKRKESERDALQTAEGAQVEPTADDSQEKEDAQTPESSKESPEHSSPDITIAMIHAEDPPTAGEEGCGHTGDEPGTGADALDVSKEGQESVAESSSEAVLCDKRQVKTATSRAEFRRRLERRYTTVPVQLPQSTSLTGKRQPPPSQQQTATTTLVSPAAPGRLRRTITSLSMFRGRRSSATRVSPAMMCRIQDAEKIYGGQ